MSTKTNSNSKTILDMLSLYFKSFPKLLAVNVIFSIPFALFAALLLLARAFSDIHPAIMFMMLLFSYPFYGCITLVTREIVSKQTSQINILHVFMKSLKENYLKFVIQGGLLCLVATASFFSALLYLQMAATNPLFYALLVVSILISLYFMFVFFYLPVMTVSFDVKAKHLYKNSALMALFEVKNNVKAFLCILVLVLIFATILINVTNYYLFLGLLLVFMVLILPSSMSFFANWCILDKMVALMTKDEKPSAAKEAAVADNGPEEENTDIKQTLQAKGVSLEGDPDEFIFYGGKMIKRSVLIKQLEEENS
ncbi:MAG: hypothetical protein LBM65_05345 [Oscillospiraceae bacterium]|jgi:uncharacterized membrane protein YesL|nr:hypothetical protein [Oscillospiraceae bacterium]